MHRTYRRLLAGSAATLAALSLAAAPSMAGEDDDGEDDAAVQTPATPAVPVQGDSDSGVPSGAPQGGVATGAGGAAPDGPDAVLLGLATGGLVLLATGGGALAAVRRAER